ncbi:DUF4429 domain-containing protein [Nonomuraea longicatena]|uniref:DUF4429 domain-containing protein n=1 Tax=Nonomuraea longicatena TaxID=83682 RepID=A0ABN1PLQ7_9ACTN
MIQYSSRWRTHALLKVLSRLEVPVAAIAAVEFAAEGKKGWRLRLRLLDRADPYAEVGGLLPDRARPFVLTGGPDTELVAEYHADRLRLTVEAARVGGGGPRPEEFALGLVPPLPLRIRTWEGTASFDGEAIRLEWSDEAGSRKRRQRRVAYPLADVRRVDWVPDDSTGEGHLRVVTGEEDHEGVKPGKDLACLLTEDSAKEDAWALVMAATVTAHLWTSAGSSRDSGTHPPVTPPAGTSVTSGPAAARALEAPAPSLAPFDAAAQGGPAADADASVIYDRIRELGRLYAEGLLTDEEFSTKKAELLARL